MQVGNIPRVAPAERRTEAAARRDELKGAIADTVVAQRARRAVRAEVDAAVYAANPALAPPPPKPVAQMTPAEAKAAWRDAQRALRRHSLETRDLAAAGRR